MIPATSQLTEFHLLVEISDICTWNDCTNSNSHSHQAKILPVLEDQSPIPIRHRGVFIVTSNMWYHFPGVLSQVFFR